MSTEVPATFGSDAAKTSHESLQMPAAWLETALTALFAVATVLFVSYRGHIGPSLVPPSVRRRPRPAATVTQLAVAIAQREYRPS
jgi:hypothetical protein